MLDQWKILVISDTHGRTQRIEQVIQELKGFLDAVYFLGDCLPDGRRLQKKFPELAYLDVPGNCDFTNEGLSKTVELLGHRLFLCHGHRYSVKEDYDTLRRFALANHYDIALFGHTHMPYADDDERLLLLNPGSAGELYPLYGANYAVLCIEKDRRPEYRFGNVYESSGPILKFLQKKTEK